MMVSEADGVQASSMHGGYHSAGARGEGRSGLVERDVT